MEEIFTPNIKTIDQLAEFLKLDANLCAKSLVYISESGPVLIFMMGNDQLNETKLQSVVSGKVRAAEPGELAALTGADAGSIGPIGLKAKFRILADKRLEGANGLVSGANKNDYHIKNIDFNRDVKVEITTISGLSNKANHVRSVQSLFVSSMGLKPGTSLSSGRSIR